MSHAFRATAALHAALAEADAAISAAGRDLRAEHKRALEATEVEIVIGRMGSTVKAAEHLVAVTEAAVKKLREQLKRSMEETGAGNIAIGNGVLVSLSRKPAFLSIDDETLIPRHFFTVPEPVVDEKALEAALKSGDVPGAHMAKPNEQRLVISFTRKDAA